MVGGSSDSGSAGVPSNREMLMKKKTGQTLIPLTSTCMVELPGIEPVAEIVLTCGNVELTTRKYANDVN